MDACTRIAPWTNGCIGFLTKLEGKWKTLKYGNRSTKTEVRRIAAFQCLVPYGLTTVPYSQRVTVGVIKLQM